MRTPETALLEVDMSDAEGWRRTWGQVIAQAWSDSSYKERLLADPAAVTAERGLTPPTGKQIRIVEDTADTVHVVPPARPSELTDEQLDQAAGGVAAPTVHELVLRDRVNGADPRNRLRERR